MSGTLLRCPVYRTSCAERSFAPPALSACTHRPPPVPGFRVQSTHALSATSRTELRAATLHAAPAASSAPSAVESRQDAESSAEDVIVIADKLIGGFRSRKPAAWRKLIGFSKRWADLADPVFDRIEARASAAAAENERLALRKLGRRLREVHEELAQYDELIGRFLAAEAGEWEGVVAANRPSLGDSFFAHLETRIRAAHADAEGQQTLMTLAARVSTLVAAFDRVAADADAMADAASQFQDILQVTSIEEADRKIDGLAAEGRVTPALLLTMAKAYSSVKETDMTKEEVKDIMAHLYFKAKESIAADQPAEVRILKHLLTVDGEADRRDALNDAFTPGSAEQTADSDYLSTTPEALLATISTVLHTYDSQLGSQGMLADGAALMNPEVITRLRALQTAIRKSYG